LLTSDEMKHVASHVDENKNMVACPRGLLLFILLIEKYADIGG